MAIDKLLSKNDEDIALAANEIRKMKGGKIVVKDGRVLESLPLPIANLMTDTRILYEAQNSAKEIINCTVDISPEERQSLENEVDKLFSRVSFN